MTFKTNDSDKKRLEKTLCWTLLSNDYDAEVVRKKFGIELVTNLKFNRKINQPAPIYLESFIKGIFKLHLAQNPEVAIELIGTNKNLLLINNDIDTNVLDVGKFWFGESFVSVSNGSLCFLGENYIGGLLMSTRSELIQRFGDMLKN